MEVLRVSPSDVVRLALPPKDLYELQDNQELALASRRGMKKHEVELKKALLREGEALPGFESSGQLIFVEKDLSLFPEDSFVAALSPYVSAATQVDLLIGDAICGEIKPYLQGRHLLQLMLTALIYSRHTGINNVEGVLYFYSQKQQPKILNLANGGAEFWDQGTNLLCWAAEIFKIQADIDMQTNLKKRQKQTGKQGESLFGRDGLWEKINPQRAVELRREFDDCIDSIKEPLKKLLRS